MKSANQRGWGDKKLCVIGGDGAMYDIGFQSLSRMLASSMDINVLILDKQVYSNTGGQASTVPDRRRRWRSIVRAFPIFIYDPRKGEKIRERLSLVGNPSQKEDWWTPSSTGKPFTFVDFARTEGRFTKQFDGDGNPSSILLQTQEERLRNWHTLQEPLAHFGHRAVHVPFELCFDGQAHACEAIGELAGLLKG